MAWNKKYKRQEKYYRKNKKKCYLASFLASKKRRENNPEKFNKQRREYYIKRRISQGRALRPKLTLRQKKQRIKEIKKRWEKNNPQKAKERKTRWIKNNPNEFKRTNNRYQLKRLKTDPKFRLNNCFSSLMWNSLKNKKAGRGWESLVGYSLKDLIVHLENQFDDKMTWDNYGSYWWVDHIKARSLFRYKSTEDLEFRKCWALKNLQPMEKIANIKKGNKKIKKQSRKKVNKKQ